MTKVNSPELPACAECGMIVSNHEYHPYTACMLFKLTKNGSQVRDNLNAVQAHGVMTFVDSIIAAFESGFVDQNSLNLSQLYRIAQNHVLDNYAIKVQNLNHKWGAKLAKDCGMPSISLPSQGSNNNE